MNTLTTQSKDLRPGGTWRTTTQGLDAVDDPKLAPDHPVEPSQALV